MAERVAELTEKVTNELNQTVDELAHNVQNLCDQVERFEAPKPKKRGFWAKLGSLFGSTATVSANVPGEVLHRSEHPERRCNGDCDHCPSHYGYRHGRWYYGHGHMHGCERGGNGGASGRTLRN